MTKLVLIQDAIPSDGFQFGGQIMNQLVLLLSGEPLDSEEDIRINTTFKFYSGKLALYDDDPTLSHKLFIKVENIDTGTDKSVTFRNPTIADDFFMTEQQLQIVRNKIWSTGNQVTADLTFSNDAAITGAAISGAANILTNVPHSALLQITDKAKLHDNIVYNDQVNVFGDFNQTFRSARLRISNPATTFQYTIVAGALAGSYNLTLPTITAHSSFVLDTVTSVFTTWQKIQYSAQDALVIYRNTPTQFNVGGIAFNLQNDTPSEVTYAKISGGINNPLTGNEQGFISFQARYNGVVKEVGLINQIGQFGGTNPNNFRLFIDPVNSTAHRVLTAPNLSGQIVLQEHTNIFTAIQTIQANFAELLSIYRTTNTLNSTIGVTLDAWSSTGVKRTYAKLKTVITDNTNTSEDSNFAIDLMYNATLATKFLVHGNGNVFIGSNQFLCLSETGLTALRIFTYPDVTGKVAVDTNANHFLNKQKIQWNGTSDLLTLFKGNAAAVNSFGGTYFSALNSAANEIVFATLLAGTGSAAADIVAGTEKGQIRLQILEGGSLTTKIQITDVSLFTTGMVPRFEVGSGDLNSMYIYRPVNSAGSNVINFDLQNTSSVRKTFGQVGIRSSVATAGDENGAFHVYLAKNGAFNVLQFMIYQNVLYLGETGTRLILNTNGFTADRTFSFPDSSGQVTVNEATQTLLNKTVSTGWSISSQISVLDTSGLRFQKAAQAGVAETLLQLNITDSSSYYMVNNGSALDNIFIPRVITYNSEAGNNSAVGFYHYSNIVATSDTADSSNAVVIFDVRRADSGGTPIQFRRLYQFRNMGTNILEIYTNMFNFTNKKLVNAVFNIDESVLKHGVTNAAGDTLYYDGTKYNRKAQGGNNQFLGVVGGVLGYYTPVGTNGVLALAALTDDTTINTPQDGDTIIFDSGTNKWINGIPTFAGESNTYSNAGIDGISIILTKDEEDLPFKSMYAASTKLSIVDGGANNRVAFDVVEANLSIANMGGSIGNARITDLAWGKLSSVPDASTTVKGIVELATSVETTATLAVAASDPRLSDSRYPTPHAASHVAGQPDQLSIVDLAGNLGDSRLTDIAWTKVSGKPATFAPTNHGSAHVGNGTDPIPIATTAVRGTVELATDGENAANVVVQGNDARLSNARTPVAHNHAGADINSGTVPIAQLPVASETAKGIAELATSAEVTAGLVVQASDTRLSNARAPTAHNHAAADINSGTLSVGQGGTGKTSITSHALLKGNGTSAPNEIAVGTNDQVLAVVAGTPAWKSLNAERTGTALANGGATVYNVPHGLGVDPYCAFIQCSTYNTAFTYTTTDTYIIVTFASALPGGTNNVKFHWRAVA